tara:strand:+ start:1246 stop:1542 length:297 start_codon:yes stop_codon:yes gene_type:complete
MRTDQDHRWYIVSDPFTRPTVIGPMPYRDDAIYQAERMAGHIVKKVRCAEGEIWVGGFVVVTHYRLKVNGWEDKVPPKVKCKNAGAWKSKRNQGRYDG